MARPRKSRLVPSLTTFAEELVRAITEHVDRSVAAARQSIEDEIAHLKRDLSRLRERARSANGGGAHGGGRPKSTRTCSERGCGEPHVARGLCKNHYQQLRYAERKGGGGRAASE
ncbi:MAG TPA: hypothetical protein VFF06_05865 [Polyangia bacterium]|nr:hypothetical protein [Polyangia bacterium]